MWVCAHVNHSSSPGTASASVRGLALRDTLSHTHNSPQTYTLGHTCTNTDMHTQGQTHRYVPAHTNTCMHTDACTHVHTDTQVHAWRQLFLCSHLPAVSMHGHEGTVDSTPILTVFP